jgi:hypothetical protein
LRSAGAVGCGCAEKHSFRSCQRHWPL